MSRLAPLDLVQNQCFLDFIKNFHSVDEPTDNVRVKIDYVGDDEIIIVENETKRAVYSSATGKLIKAEKKE